MVMRKLIADRGQAVLPRARRRGSLAIAAADGRPGRSSGSIFGPRSRIRPSAACA